MNYLVLASTGSAGGFITNNILTNLINFLAPVLGIALVIFCVVQGWQIFTGGNGSSVKKLISGVLVIFCLLGIMYAAGSFDSYGKLFQSVTDSIINKGSKDAGKIVGSAIIKGTNCAIKLVS